MLVLLPIRTADAPGRLLPGLQLSKRAFAPSSLMCKKEFDDQHPIVRQLPLKGVDAAKPLFRSFAHPRMFAVASTSLVPALVSRNASLPRGGRHSQYGAINGRSFVLDAPSSAYT